MEKLTNIIESLLFVSGKEISIQDIADKLEISKNEVKLAALELQEKYSGDSGLLFLCFNDKLQFGSNPDYGEAVSAVINPIRERELSRSMLETIAIIAYKQPVTRMDLEELRGVSSEYAIQVLLKLGLIEIVGKKDAVGRPALFGTTDKFLKRFQISSLEDLPDYDALLDQVKMLNSTQETYLYHKDVYVDDGSEDIMPPQRQFIPKEEIAVSEEETEVKDITEEEVPDFLKDDEDLELLSGDDEDIGEEFDDEEDEDDDGEFGEQYSMYDDDEEYEDEEEDDSDYDDDDEEVDDSWEEDDE